ncbi:LysR substrate-binding domain-containing protein [Hydrogenophaga sp.]|uniref:LysR substrate-binding domain-containing protein n=1 Tax=Hydrogenophaga sp. TaxID=1904254 RepID=UPI002730B9B6|nr:LysR substrate-binding domain-containing protein [Hydrogenophaga sp.]MDP1782421.1 LysR substrate-binding domain-containing protein [Hydrogenophaga sp.]MDP2249031.1 LysR substrate-binding domain-containing protein [Hydrogenophaga sp.]MDP3106502.1 LysR substrate-binding domain-containing protein [Hydrogenophaga sp.]MDP3351142.1 LysR substrate-binding domain-containing protein [Hydrogenophaga sp.]MDZ4396941.1 LysR substrate-binding domain-containing protein [Hydrogenophaga sp.]
MDLKQLEYFVRVAELGSFTRASMALNVAQPALSRQVRLLEVELRQNLLVRNGRGATPTEAGKLLLAHGRGILHQVERAREELGRVRGALAGRVAIGLPPSLARVLTVPLTRAFRAQLPEASLSISEALSVTMLEWLTTGRLDIAVLYNAQPVAEIEIHPLRDEELLLIEPRPPGLSEDPPTAIGLREVAELPLVIPSRPNAIRMQVETEMANIGCRPNVALEIDGVSAILDLVADGAGAALLSRNAVASSIRPSAYRMRPVHPPLKTRLCLATSSQRPATLTQQKTLELIRQTLDALNKP